MAGPWEKYAQAQPSGGDAPADGPWSKYQAPQPDAQPSSNGIVKSAINSLPMVGGVAGGILGTPLDAVSGPAGNIVGAGIGGYLGTAAKNLINSYYDPASAPSTATGAVVDATKGGVEQGLMQGTGEAVAPYVAKGVSAVADPVSDYLRSMATKKAVAATGATGKQALKFAPEAGQELLDRGIVKFGDSQAKIAGKATDALEAAGNKISSVLTDLDKRGATVDQSDIVDSLRKRATDLSDDPSQYGVSEQLNRLADKMEERISAKGGNSEISLSKAEQTKRGFQAGANYNSAPIDLSISKEAAGIYQKAVEDAATKFDPKAADAFTEAKKTYGLLNPIQDAAEKRASTLNQSPHGGLLDTAAIIAGEGLAGAPGAIAAPIVRRALSTRSASSMAATANAAGKLIGGVPAVAESAIPAAIQSQGQSVTPIGSGVGNLIALPAAAQQTPPDNSKVAQSNANRTPARGPDAWAQRGVQNLGIDSALAQTLLSDPKGKQLLIQASDLSPNSRAMKQIKTQIQKGWGQ